MKKIITIAILSVFSTATMAYQEYTDEYPIQNSVDNNYQKDYVNADYIPNPEVYYNNGQPYNDPSYNQQNIDPYNQAYQNHGYDAVPHNQMVKKKQQFIQPKIYQNDKKIKKQNNDTLKNKCLKDGVLVMQSIEDILNAKTKEESLLTIKNSTLWNSLNQNEKSLFLKKILNWINLEEKDKLKIKVNVANFYLSSCNKLK